MTRTTVVAALGALALGAGLADAQEAPALEPPLEAPAQAPSGTPPEPPTVERPRPADRPASRPFLVIPGVTAPTPSRTARKPVAEMDVADPAIDVPDDAPGIHLRLEPIPDKPAPRREPEPRATAEPPADAEATPARPHSTLGRLLGPNAGAGGRDVVSIESGGDPAVEAAVKRRVEKQVADAVGNRVSDVTVRVSGRSVSIHARATRLWYRWGARRALESLQMPPGYRGRVVVD